MSPDPTDREDNPKAALIAFVAFFAIALGVSGALLLSGNPAEESSSQAQD